MSVMENSIGDLPDAGEKVWFCIQEDAHVGPFSFTQLQNQCSPQQLVWAKGWPEPLTLYILEEAYYQQQPRVEVVQTVPLSKSAKPKWPWLVALGVLAIGAGFIFYPRGLVRPKELALPAFRQAQDYFNTKTKNEPITWVGVRRDYARLWMVDRSAQSCVFEIQMLSSAENNLSGQPIALQAQSVSKMHWVVIDSWSLARGQRLWPGYYNVKIARRSCRPEGMRAWWEKPERPISKAFSFPLAVNVTEMKNRLARMKSEKVAREKKLKETLMHGWRDIEEKCRTLAAITLQIEAGFQPLLNREIPWKARLKPVIDDYTLRFGGFLTNFVIKNDEDFVKIAALPMEEKNVLLARQPVVNEKARLIGFHSMKLIEFLQLGVPARPELEKRLIQLSSELAKLRQELEVEARSVLLHY